jgi:lipopolysaccharide export system protein LptA
MGDPQRMAGVRTVILLILLLSGNFIHAQDTVVETTKILLEKADFWKYDTDIRKDVQRITGNVIMSHDSAFLYCDSAYLNELTNSVVAYGNVQVKLSDTLNLFSDSLVYDGNTKVARARSNVRLIDNQTILTTDTLVYDRNTSIAQYDYWGKIVNDKNVLVSHHGYYFTDRKEFFFKEKGILINPEYIMHSDTLMYNTVTEVAYFYGPSDIVSIDKTDSIYCENGWYDTKLNIARFREHARIYHEAQYFTGDSLYYERKNGFGQAFRDAMLIDTVQNTLLLGDYGELRRKEGYAFMTDSAVVIMVDKQDSLFMHADTVRATFGKDDHIRDIFCFFKVKFFREDLQGMCDSLVYHGTDSVMTMYREPVIWSGKNQLTADSIALTIRNGELDTMALYNSAFIISQDDTNKFNQIKGRDMTGYFHKNELYKIRVIGNAESLYYSREEDRTLIGINKTVSSDILIFLEKNELISITYIDRPDAHLVPEKDVSPYDLKLKNFRWVEERRPWRKEDIFTW